MWFPLLWYVRPAKPQISLRISAVWSELLLVAWVFYDCLATDWTAFGVSKIKRRLPRLVWVYNCQNTTLLEISCIGSYKSIQDGVLWRNSILFHEIIYQAGTTAYALCWAWTKILPWAATCDFQQCGILTRVDSDEPLQHPLRLWNSKWCSVSS